MNKLLPIRPGPGALACALLLAASVAAAAAQKAPDPAKRYADCMALARDKPQEGLLVAQTWQKEKGEAAARHCVAAALIGLSRFDEAAEELEQVADEVEKTRGPALAVALLTQAGQAWLDARQPQRALAVQSRALKLDPKNVQLLVDRGYTLGSSGQLWEALDDFNEANALAPNRADVLVLRATAYRHLETYDLALQDIEQAIALDPKNPNAWLERGNIRAQMNDPEGARTDWLQVVKLAPETEAGQMAQAKLERLDVKTD